ncbi:MAG: AAA family ATPase [Chloroflexi bacterium]|nr:AAA family ATPase [Chloroflexota bacterium]
MRIQNGAAPVPRLAILLLGPPQLELDGRPLEGLRRKNRALLYYLAAQSKPCSREHILSLFWTDRDRAAAQQILRTMLHDLRKRLGDALVIENEMLSLTPETDIDARRFEAGLSAHAGDATMLAGTLDLYHGGFLEGFALADTPTFDDWVFAERERYEQLAIRGLTALAQRHEARRDWTAALNAVNRALAFDPLQEDIQRTALRLDYMIGDRPGAIRRYESLCKMLDAEMGVPPMPETRALYDSIITDALASEPMPPPAVNIHPASTRSESLAQELPFIGRAHEMKTMSQAVSAGKLILVDGEPGIGKTRLVREFIAAQPPALVLNGSAHELEVGLPYQPIAEALRGLASLPEWSLHRDQLDLEPIWRSELTRLVPELLTEPSPSTTSDESRMWQALYRFLASLAQRRRVVLFLDDLHWADASTLAWLGYLLRQATPPGLLLVAATRPIEPRSKLATLLQTLHREQRVLRLEMKALEATDLRALAERLEPAHADSLAHWLVRYAEGNPFFVTELVRYAGERRLLDREADASPAAPAAPAPPAVPENIQQLIVARLARLSDGARRVLDAAAIIGREFDAGLVIRVSGLTEDAVLDAFDELHSALLVLGREGGLYAFDHSLTMQVVLQKMTDLRRLALHRRVAEAMEEIHRDHLDQAAGLIARHWVEANVPARVAYSAFRAGQYAAGLAAWAEAIAFYEQALQAETNDTNRTDLFLALGTARFNHGESARASESFMSAVTLAQASHDLARLEEAHLALNTSLIPQSRYREAIELAEELRRAGPPELALCAEICWGTALGLESAHPVQAEAHLRLAEELLAAPRGFETRITRARMIYQLAGVTGQQGKIAEAVAYYWQALALVRENETALDLQRHVLLYNNLAYHLHLLNDPEASEFARTGLQFAREKGTRTHQSYLLSTSGEIALAQNDLDAAERFFSEGLELAEQLTIPERIAGLTANLGLVARQRGDTARARELLTDALARANQIGASHLAVRIRMWLAPLLPPDQAWTYLREAREIAEAGHYARLLDDIAQLERESI